MESALKINSYQKGTVRVIEISGRLDAEYAELVRNEFLKLIVEHRNFVLDLAQMDYLDSTGLGALVFCLKSSKEYNGTLKIARLKDKPRLILEITRAYRIFDIYDDLESAIEAAASAVSP